MSAIIFLEGAATGPDSKDLKIRCREGFRRLLEKCGYAGQSRLPRLVASGSRGSAFSDFQNALRTISAGDYAALWIDSEDPTPDIEKAWSHLRTRDGWTRPPGAKDDQVLFMTTCMETWIVADRDALTRHYGSSLQLTALPPLVNLESRRRDDVQERLEHATRRCQNAYRKGKRSFEALGKIAPETLAKHLPSFVRIRRILDLKLVVAVTAPKPDRRRS